MVPEGSKTDFKMTPTRIQGADCAKRFQSKFSKYDAELIKYSPFTTNSAPGALKAPQGGNLIALELS